MICPNCKKEVLSPDKFCPYCGAAIETEEPVVEAPADEVAAEETTVEASAAEETAETTVEAPVAEETAETTVEAPVAEEAAEPADEPVGEPAAEPVEEPAKEPAEEPVDATAAEIAAALENSEKGKKKSGAAVKILAVLVAIAAVVAAFFLGGKLLGGNGDTEETTALDTTADITENTTDTTAAVTDEADPGIIPFADEFPEDYTTFYPDGFEYKNVKASDYITLGDYKGQTAEVTASVEITDEALAKYVEYFLLQYAELGDAITDRPAAMGDVVLIDYAGTVGGVAFEGGTAKEQTVTLGMGQYIPGFEEGIVGMNIGETKDVTVTFPEDYGKEELNGKEAVFTITLHSITENVLPEYNDEFVSTNFGMDTVADFEKEVRNMMAEEATSERYAAILKIITESAVMNKYPDGTVEDYIYQQISSDKTACEYYGMNVEDYINAYYGMTVPQYEIQVRAMAENMIKQEFALYAVAQAEGITVTDEDMSVEIANYLEYYNATDIESLCSTMGVSEQLLNNSFHFSVVYTKVMEFMMENTTFIVAE
ncbi:MAG: trigger factor [Clostridia bacterium]|nr:trigger factor [Clostridia bacterium]